MSASEYYIGIVAIFFSFSLTKFLEGVFDFWMKRRVIEFFFVHVVWVAICFLSIFQYMWSVFIHMDKYIDENFINFVVFLSPVIVFHVLCFFLFPDLKSYSAKNKFPLYQYFENNKKAIYLLMILFIILVQIELTIFPDRLESNLLIMIRVVTSLLLIISIIYKNKTFDYVISIAGLVTILGFTYLTSAPNHTKIDISIRSNSIQKNEFIWKNCFVQINDEEFPININSNTGKVLPSKLFRFGDKIKIRVVNKYLTNIDLIQPVEYFNIDLNGEILVNVDIK
jgi:hypothetical protein